MVAGQLISFAMLTIKNNSKTTFFFYNDKNFFTQSLKKKKYLFFVDKKLKNAFKKFAKIKSNKIYYLKANESLKDYKNVQKILLYLHKNNISSDDLIYVVGGGTISDLISFVSSIYKRGVDYILLPTTTMAAVDASSAGKTCINFLGTKNLIGSYHYAKKVFIFDFFLKSEPIEIRRQGLSEIFKYSLLCSRKLFEQLGKKNINNKKIFFDVIKIRDKLKKIHPLISNLGHTYAHALEGCMKISHGDSVALGLIFETYMAWQKNIISFKIFKIILRKMYILKLYNKFPKKINQKKLINLMLNDKKSKSEKIGFVFIKNIGQLKFFNNKEYFYQLDKKEIKLFLKKFNDYLKKCNYNVYVN